MNPTEFANKIRKIAAAIEASTNPSRALVAADLKRLLAEMSAPKASAPAKAPPAK